MSKKYWYFALSLLIIIPGVISLIMFGLKLSVDFTGGTLLEYQFTQPIEQTKLQNVLTQDNVNVSSIVYSDNNTYLIRTKSIPESKIAEVKNLLSQDFGQVNEISVENVGPVIGAETTRNAVIAILIASIAIILYLALSFRKVPKPASSWRFGITAVGALLHDVLLLIGVFSILGHFLGVEVDVLFVTALLTIIGFSVHDTIVVFDRIRENLPKHLSSPFVVVANISVTQTLGRSLNTSLTVLLTLLALYLFGGETIKWFIVALIVGIISGTYSSIFNATALLSLWEEKLGH
ncbi:protein translocase subunit SecF [Patescibacteria group bacterium]|nr:protein translocase subunit SecF [Patescibacteria group bacterium]MCL5409730.1 protein translocase subunit SecF [Patescibacteria group bacterium]